MSAPAPYGAPSARLDGLMVFDGVCNVCSGYVRLVSALDRDGRIRFTPLQSPYGRTLSQAQGVDPDDPATFLFFERGQAHQATDGLAAMLAFLPRPWCWLRVVTVIPRPLRDAAYRWLARNRYRLFGKRATCMVPSPQLRARFIEQAPPETG